MFWKTRWEPSIDGSNTPNRTLVTYKETHYDAPTDPQDPPTWTGSWMDPRFSPPGDGGQPQNALTGQLFDVNSGNDRYHCAGAVQQAAVLAQYPGGQPAVRPVHTLAPGVERPSATSGTSTPTTGSALPG